jgi:hypothetical protein
VSQSLWKPTAGLWGPAAFVAATVIGGAMQPGYDHRRFHISGLAAHGARSAPVMIPGFITLGIAGLVTPATGLARPLVRVAGAGTMLAGVFRCSDVRCPDPTRDPKATTEDAVHAAVSIVTFIVWTALPSVDASQAGSTRARVGNLLLGAITAAGFGCGRHGTIGRSAQGLGATLLPRRGLCPIHRNRRTGDAHASLRDGGPVQYRRAVTRVADVLDHRLRGKCPIRQLGDAAATTAARSTRQR